jgi:large subunit ribosomal protein L32e
MTEDYENMTVAELKVQLKEAGLPVSGKKADLVARLSDVGDAPVEETVVEEAVVEEAVVEEAVVEEAVVEEAEDDNWDDEKDWDDEVSVVHVAKQKPVLDDATKAALALRAEQKKATPSFRRTEWFRYKRLSRSGWRAPHGMDNKQRKNLKYRSSLVRVGHGKVSAAHGLHPSGFREVMVQNSGDLEQIDPETEAARVGGTVGRRKCGSIYSRADELGIRVLNRRRDV